MLRHEKVGVVNTTAFDSYSPHSDLRSYIRNQAGPPNDRARSSNDGYYALSNETSVAPSCTDFDERLLARLMLWSKSTARAYGWNESAFTEI